MAFFLHTVDVLDGLSWQHALVWRVSLSCFVLRPTILQSYPTSSTPPCPQVLWIDMIEIVYSALLSSLSNEESKE